jgi:hypothetical protein
MFSVILRSCSDLRLQLRWRKILLRQRADVVLIISHDIVLSVLPSGERLHREKARRDQSSQREVKLVYRQKNLSREIPAGHIAQRDLPEPHRPTLKVDHNSRDVMADAI